jgi:8-oxo-dGTP pyrophosphatase MutT (NUDIX family)
MYSNRITSPDTRVKAGVGVIIVDDQERILLEQRYDNGMWGLPGGGIEPGESVLEAALREVKEETGLDIRIKGLLGIYSEPAEGRIVTYPDNQDVAQLVDVVIIADRVSGTLSLSRESIRLDFFLPEALPSDIVPPAIRPIRDYIAKRTGVIA